MTMEQIRKQYGVPAKRGARVEYTGGAKPETGTIVRASGSCIVVKLDGRADPYPLHPTWKLRYLPGAPKETP